MKTAATNLTDIIAGAAPWLAPIPTAWLVCAQTIKHLAWPVPVAICAALIVESLGLAATNTALELRDYNASKRKTDPRAPAWLAGLLVAGYILIAVVLTVALDVLPGLARWAPAIFPALSLTGAVILALRADHRRRLAAIRAEKAERRAARINAPMRSKPARNAGASCALCGASLASQQAVAAHMRWKHPQPAEIAGNGNGHKNEPAGVM